MKKYPILGSHVSMSKENNYLIGAVKTTIANHANTLMIFTGSPQSTTRIPIKDLHVTEMHKMLTEAEIDINKLVVHAPYLINIANSVNHQTWNFGVNFLSQEMERCEAIGINLLVLHPGASTQGSPEESLKKIVEGLNVVTQKPSPVKIALETMSGKGTEVGTNFEQLKYVIDHVNHPERIGICLDTCHLNDAGYDLKKWSQVKAELKINFGWEKIWAIHLNDSKSPINAHKDRHENIGYGTIGFATLNEIAWDPDFAEIPKILETPYLGKIAPYQAEIADLQSQTFTDPFVELKKN